MSDNYQHLLKLIVVGDSGTGKSSLLHRFVSDTYAEEHSPTIGVEFGATITDVGGQSVKLQIWDTAGQERYRSVTRSYYRGAAGCCIVYDITKRQSFESVPQWLEDVRHLIADDAVLMLIGNKSDLQHHGMRQVQHNEASVFAQENGLLHFETSAATGEFVTDAFLKVARVALDRRREAAEASSTVDLNTSGADSSSYSILRCCF